MVNIEEYIDSLLGLKYAAAIQTSADYLERIYQRILDKAEFKFCKSLDLYALEDLRRIVLHKIVVLEEEGGQQSRVCLDSCLKSLRDLFRFKEPLFHSHNREEVVHC